MSKFQPKTLWMGNIDPYMDETFVRGLFFGEKDLTTVKVIRDKSTGFPAGYGFLEFASHAAAARVLERYNGKPMPGNTGNAVFRLNWAQYSESSKSGTEFSIFVGDLSPDVTETQLQKAFMDNFHSVQSVRIVMDPLTGISKGYGFVRFSNEEEGREALISMQGFFIGSRPIRVSTATPKKQLASNSYGDDDQDPTSEQFSPTTSPSSPLGSYYSSMTQGSYSLYSYYYPGYNLSVGTSSPARGDITGDLSPTNEVDPLVAMNAAARPVRPVVDINLFMRPHNVGLDNNAYITRKMGSIHEEATCGNRSNYYLYAVDVTPYSL